MANVCIHFLIWLYMLYVGNCMRIMMRFCVSLVSNDTVLFVIKSCLSTLKNVAKSSMRYAGKMAWLFRTLLSCEWSLLMLMASSLTLIFLSASSAFTFLQITCWMGVIGCVFIHLFFAAKVLLLWHMVVA